MQRGEVWWVNFDPSISSESQQQRPAVILSNDAANKHLNRVQIVPLSTQVDRRYPSETLVMLKGTAHKAMADQIATVSKRRLSDRIGRISAADLAQIERVVRLQLGFNP